MPQCMNSTAKHTSWYMLQQRAKDTKAPCVLSLVFPSLLPEASGFTQAHEKSPCHHHRNPACRCSCFSIFSFIQALLNGRYAVSLASYLRIKPNEKSPTACNTRTQVLRRISIQARQCRRSLQHIKQHGSTHEWHRQ